MGQPLGRGVAHAGARRARSGRCSTQLWQPLAPGSHWFVAPALLYTASSIDLYEHGPARRAPGLRATDVEAGRRATSSPIGATCSSAWSGADGRVRSRWCPRANRWRACSFHETATYLQLQTTPSIHWRCPAAVRCCRHASTATAAPTGERRPHRRRPDRRFASAPGTAMSTASGRTARSGLAPLSLGGFLRLSGTPRDSLGGAAGRAGPRRDGATHRRHAGRPGRCGARWASRSNWATGSSPAESVRWGALQQAGSAFVSVDTRFGPFFLAPGATRGGGSCAVPVPRAVLVSAWRAAQVV